MIRKAAQNDWPAIQAFLAPRVATSMFLSGNLRDHGLNASGSPKATTVWISEAAGQITNVFGLAEAGYFVFEAPAVTPDLAAPLKQVMAGKRLIGLNGERRQASAVMTSLGLEAGQHGDPLDLPHFQLGLNRLAMPSGPGRLRPMAETDIPLLTEWRRSYDVEIFGSADLPESRSRSGTQTAELVASGRGRILELDGQPVAMTAFNAVLPQIVQVGGVFTPPPLRGRGFARRAVALHLEEARAAGVSDAILFASGAAASRAYEAIGFRRIGSYRVMDFAKPVMLEAA
jgi:RimJ/RimL family protein N-acetyltransferase